MKIIKRPKFNARGGAVELGLLVLSIGLSILAGELLKKKNKSPIEDDKPTTLSTRGSFANWTVGIRRLGPVFCWAGNREIRKEKTGGGKGVGSSPEQDVFYEAGWHVICIGQTYAMRQIIAGGKVIFGGTITADSHPSGSTVDLGEEGAFTIFWGEEDQPINTFLGNANRVSISSRWPFACYVVWNKKRLGTSPNWPIIDYVMERRPIHSPAILTQSQSWYDPQLTLDGTITPIIGSLANADPDTGYLEVDKDRTNRFKPNTVVAISGNAIPDGDLTVRKTELVQTPLGSFSFTISTRVFFQEGTAGADSNGTLQPYSADDTDGANIAHIAAELLFAPFPEGLSLDPLGVEPWDLQSFEDWGVEAETDEWRSSIVGTEGETAAALFGAMLQDHGAMVPIDTVSGKLIVQRVRFPVGTIPNLGEDVFSDDLSEREVVLDDKPVDKLIFEFKDRALQFASATIAIDDDGQAFYLEHQAARKVPISSTVHFDTASKLSELRSPEELADAAEFRLNASRESRGLLPGQAVVATGFEEVLRVLGVDVDPLSERVNVRVIPDFFGAPKTTFVNITGGGQPTVEDPLQDVQFDVVEIPEQLNSGSIAIFVPRIRASATIISAAIHLSRDNTTYTLWGTDTFVQTGGVLDAALPADGPTWVPTGPEYVEAGPDNATLTQDLSADPVNFGLGRQLCVIVSSAGTEICFLTKATVVSGTNRRLDGLLRARYDTRKLAHPVGAHVYIFDPDMATPITDPLLEIGEDIYVKTQPATTAGSVSLAGVAPAGKVIEGKGLVPIKPDHVRVVAPRSNVPSYLTGEDVTVKAAVSTATSINTGAGFQNAGTVIGLPTIPGAINFELLTLADAVVDSKSGSSQEQTWTNAELIAALGSEVSFKIRATHVVNSLTSASATVTITKL